jgi:hypothetical protein
MKGAGRPANLKGLASYILLTVHILRVLSILVKFKVLMEYSSTLMVPSREDK